MDSSLTLYRFCQAFRLGRSNILDVLGVSPSHSWPWSRPGKKKDHQPQGLKILISMPCSRGMWIRPRNYIGVGSPEELILVNRWPPKFVWCMETMDDAFQILREVEKPWGTSCNRWMICFETYVMFEGTTKSSVIGSNCITLDPTDPDLVWLARFGKGDHIEPVWIRPSPISSDEPISIRWGSPTSYLVR